jgi:hypothetical protein
MTTIITRHARDLHADDVITYDPDHDRDVRWRTTRPAEVTLDGVAIIDYVDEVTGATGIAYYGSLRDLPVEPARGAQ